MCITEEEIGRFNGPKRVMFCEAKLQRNSQGSPKSLHLKCTVKCLRGKCLIADLWLKSPQRAIKQHFGSFLRGQVLLISLKSGRQMEMTCLVD